MAKKGQKKVWWLVLALVLVVGGGVLFMGAVSGWFSQPTKMELDAEYYCGDECDGGLDPIGPEQYGVKTMMGESFVIFVEQEGCTTASRLKRFMLDYVKEKQIKAFSINFENMKKTSLHDAVKYYPSVAMIAKGKVFAFLRADSDEDSDAYNKYEAFKEWMDSYLK